MINVGNIPQELKEQDGNPDGKHTSGRNEIMKRTWEDRERDRDIYLDERLGGYGVFCIECEYYSHCLKDPDDPQRADFCPKREA